MVEMASGVSIAQSVLASISEGHLECSICSNRFRQPKVLDCFHSFCLKCLVELRKGQNPYSTKLACPLCRGDTALKDNSVDDLPNNFTLSALVEEFAKQERLLDSQAISAIESPKEKWGLKTEFKRSLPEQTTFKSFHNVFDVAVFSDSEIVAVDNIMGSLFEIPVRKDEPPVVPYRLDPPDLSAPKRVRVNKDDQVIVLDYSDEPEVKIFSRDYRLLHQFKPEHSSCLAVDDDNQIALGNKAATIHLYTPDGALVKTLQYAANMLSEHMTTFKQRFIYTNWRERKLLSIDYDGKMVFSVDVTSDIDDSSWGPSGVCCDKEGNIYVAVNGWSSSDGQIHRFTPDGKHVGCVIKGCGSPRGIALTPDGGNLVVAGRRSVKIFHRL